MERSPAESVRNPVLASILALLSASVPPYALADLRLDVGGAGGVFLSDRGTVAGHLRAGDGKPAPFVWRPGRLTRLKDAGRIAGLNARDQLAVDAAAGPGIWEARKGVRLWPAPSADDSFASAARALGIDESGNLAVVRAPLGSAGGNYRVVTWPRASRIAETYEPVALSPEGLVLARNGGDGRSEPRREDAFLYDEGSLRTIGEEGAQIEPVAVARGEWVCGALSTLEDPRPRPFVWHKGRFVRPLWGNEGRAVSVNEHGQAVGEAEGVPVLWIGGAARELRTLLGPNARYRPTEARAINAKGQILVEAEPIDRPFPRTLLLLTPALMTPARKNESALSARRDSADRAGPLPILGGGSLKGLAVAAASEHHAL